MRLLAGAFGGVFVTVAFGPAFGMRANGFHGFFLSPRRFGRQEDFIAIAVLVQKNSPVIAVGVGSGSVDIEERFLALYPGASRKSKSAGHSARNDSGEAVLLFGGLLKRHARASPGGKQREQAPALHISFGARRSRRMA